MKNIVRLSVFAILLVAASSAIAEDDGAPSIRTTINKKRIFIGDRIRYTVQMVSRYDLEIELPQFKDSKIGDCEIKDSGKSIKGSIFGKRRYTNWLDITSYYTGKRTIPAIEIRYREKGEGQWKKLKTDELIFTVETVLPRSSKLTDIKDIKGVLYPFSPLKLFLLVLLVSIILWLSIRFVLKKIFRKAPPRLAHEIALEEIESARKQLALGGEVKEYYVRISDAVRKYIEAVFLLKAPEMTTPEFLSLLSRPDTITARAGDHKRLPAVYKDLLMVFMEACDLVKFARYAPSRSDIESVFNTAKKFIEETIEVYMKKETRA